MASSSPIEGNPSAGVVRTSSSSCPSEASPPWSDLHIDLLVPIFSRLNCVDLIIGVSSVCSSWRAASRWVRILDLSDWDYVTARLPFGLNFSQVFNGVLGFVHDCQLIEEVRFPRVAKTQDLISVALRLPNLLYISYPYSEVGELASALPNFKSLKGLAVDLNIYHQCDYASVLEKHCSDLSELKVVGNMSWNSLLETIYEIHPKLRKLEMHCSIFTSSILKFLESLEHLEYLDIPGYALDIPCAMPDDCERFRVIEKAASRLNMHISYGSRIIFRRAPIIR